MGESIDDEAGPLATADAHANDRDADCHRQRQETWQQNGAAQDDQKVEQPQVQITAEGSLQVGDRRDRRHHDNKTEDLTDSERFFREQRPQLQGCLGNAGLRP